MELTTATNETLTTKWEIDRLNDSQLNILLEDTNIEVTDSHLIERYNKYVREQEIALG